MTNLLIATLGFVGAHFLVSSTPLRALLVRLLGERLYLPLLGGLFVTIRHFFKNFFNPKGLPTIEYPEKRRDYSHRYRGHHILTSRPDGSVRCVACFLCAQNCPAECIHIEAGEHSDVNIEKYPVVYEIDMLRCVFCGYCQEVCPEEAIHVGVHYENAEYSRDRFVYDLERLSAQTHPVSTLWDPTDPKGE